MTLLVIDGYNLIRRTPELKRVEEAGGLEAGREALERLLAGCAARPGVRVIVVYDGAPGRTASVGGIEVRFSACADETVVELARAHAAAGEQVRAVSSDRAGVLSMLAGTNRVETLSAERFLAGLTERKGRGRKSGKPVGMSAPADKPSRVSRDEVLYWLEAFGEPETRSEPLEKTRPGKKPREQAEGREESEAESSEPSPEQKSSSADERLRDRRRERHLRRQRGRK